VNEPKTRPVDLEDLSARTRRGSLSAAERRSFERALAADPSLRVAHQVGSDFDRAFAVRPGDDELIARVVDRVVRAPRSAAAGGRALKIGFILAATLAATSAGAALWKASQKPRQGSALLQHRADGSGLNRTAPRAPAPAARAQDRPSDPAPPEAAPPKAQESVPPLPAVERHDGSADTPEPVTAKTLFRDANAARRDGDFGRATALYAELERRFPRSEEARLSHVSVGKLLLAQGNVVEADRHFATYLNGGAGALTEEALVGRAQSLRALGRGADERVVWQDLLRRFPASVYAQRARQRLAEAGP
jgi:TolA-binding protein